MILITGASGFLGTHITKILNQEATEFKGISSKDFDLTILNEVDRCLSIFKPHTIIHLAALSGGIGMNTEKPYDFFHINSLLITNMFHSAAKNGVKRIIYTMGGCSYPANAISPISENQMWNGYPQPESAAYSSVKKMGIVAAAAYQSLGLQTTVLVPGNMYGEYDNYSLTDSHVIPAMIRKFIEAESQGVSSVQLWGSGNPKRDFVYARDVASCVVKTLKMNNLQGPINLSSGNSISIRDLAMLIAQMTGFRGELIWQTNKPDGQMIKIFDTTLAKELKLSCETPLEEGIQNTIDWYRKSLNTGMIRL
jgi:GDP-L-fucose synthase